MIRANLRIEGSGVGRGGESIRSIPRLVGLVIVGGLDCSSGSYLAKMGAGIQPDQLSCMPTASGNRWLWRSVFFAEIVSACAVHSTHQIEGSL